MSGHNLIYPELPDVWREAQLQVFIDFDRDDDFSDAYEDITQYVRQCDWRLGAHQPFQQMADETELNMTLINLDRRFSPSYAAGPYYGELDIYCKVKVQITFNGTTYPMYLGYIDLIKPEPSPRFDCTIRCVGVKQQLQDQQIAVPLLTNVRSDEAIRIILEKLILPPAMNSNAWFLGVPGSSELGQSTYLADSTAAMDLDTGSATFEYVADNWDQNFHGNQYVGEDWSKGFKGWDAIADIVKAERGRFFFDREGVAVFWNRAYTQTLVATGGGFSARSDQPGVSFPPRNFKGYRWGSEIANEIEVTAYPRSADSVATVIYELDEPITVRAGQERTITAKFTPDDSSAQVSAIEPYIHSLTYTGSLTFDIEWLADKAKITITNVAQTDQIESAGNATTTNWQTSTSAVYASNDASKTDGELTTLILMGKKLTAYEEIVASVEDGVSRSLYGGRAYKIDAKLLSDPNDAHAIAEYELSRRKNPTGHYESIVMAPLNRLAIQRMLTSTIGRKYTVIEDSNGLPDEGQSYLIIGERHEWHKNTGWGAEYFIEPLDEQVYWTLGTRSGLGLSTRLGY